MNQLKNKKILITGVSNSYSLAWGITERFIAEGAEVILSYQGPSHLRRIKNLCKSISPAALLPCDFTKEKEVEELFQQVDKHWNSIDGFIHSMAYANVQCLQSDFTECSKTDFMQSMDISVYSLITACHYLKTRMANGGSVLTLTYNGSQKVLPNYHLMGLSKAALESCVRYLASELSPQGITVNAISAGPIETIASASIPDFQDKLKSTEGRIPTRASTTKEDVANLACFLASSLSRNITGSTYYVDGGLHTLGW